MALSVAHILAKIAVILYKLNNKPQMEEICAPVYCELVVKNVLWSSSFAGMSLLFNMCCF